MSKKIKTICIDTLTGIQNEEYMTARSKPNFDKWRDFGTDIWKLISFLQNKGFEIVMVIGPPGTGKSSGMRTLEPGTNIWYNADKKNPVWTDGKKEYGSKRNPISPYHVIPTNYADITKHIIQGFEKNMFVDEPLAFLTGHIENVKSGSEYIQQLKTLGNMSTAMNLEGKLETVLYSKVDAEGATNKYLLETQNNGYNTARSPMGLFEPTIDNDYELVRKKIMEEF